MFKVMSPFQPAPPPGVGSPFDWGREERVRELLGDAFDLDFVERDNPQTGESGAWVWQAFLDTYGPSRTLAASLEPERREGLADAIRAGRAGAEVVGVDITPALLEQARANAEGLPSRWDEGDAQNLPYEDASFDVVVSCFGAVFAPDDQAVARELGRVCRRGGR